ncbi:MAG: recombinase family protein, partial [Candidatus Cloacimonetes bacterium]|nr:recombinase family protein [Candidatus Cloacimonadota bacterium]
MDQFGFAKKETKKAVIYLRVSTEEQVGNYSLDTQEDICLKEAERQKLEVVNIFREEGRSAKTINGRPVLIEMLEFCRKHRKEIEAIIIYRLDRISRQTADYLAIRKKLAECDIKLISATEPTGNSPTEKFVETMLAGFAQMDNDVRSERTRNGMRARFMAGLNSGYVPTGYLNQNGYTIKDPETFEAMKEGWDIMSTGDKTLREMVVILSEKGIYGGIKNGKKRVLRHQQLSRIFRNKFYAGKIVSKKYGQEIQGQHPPMVSEEKFYRVQAILDGRN